MQMCLMTRPQAPELVIKLDEALEYIGTHMGVPPQFIPSEGERKALIAKAQAAAAKMAAAQALQQQAQTEAQNPTPNFA